MELSQRLWVVSELYYPEQTSTGYFLTRIAEGLADTRSVHVMCGQPTYSERGIKAPTREERGGTHIYRMTATHFGKDRLFLRAINMVTLTLAMMWFALRNFRSGDQLLIVTNPPTLPPIIGWIARRKRMQSFLLIHDVYPEVLAATQFLKPSSLAYRLLERFFSKTYGLYDAIVVLGRDMAQLVEVKLRMQRRRIEIIPNWGDSDEIQPLARAENPFFAAANIEAPYVFQFSGNIGRTHDVETILDAAKRLRSREDILFVFAGYGGKSDLIMRRIAVDDLRNVRLLPRQPRELLGPLLASATATMISFVSSMKGISVPSRMYNIMAAGTPIIALSDAESELAIAVSEAEAGWVLEPGDDAALAGMIARLASPDGAAEAARRGHNGRQAAEQHYQLGQILAKYRALLAMPPANHHR